MYHLNYFEFMVQQRVQILIKYVVCMRANTLLNNNMAVLFTLLTRLGVYVCCFVRIYPGCLQSGLC